MNRQRWDHGTSPYASVPRKVSFFATHDSHGINDLLRRVCILCVLRVSTAISSGVQALRSRDCDVWFSDETLFGAPWVPELFRPVGRPFSRRPASWGPSWIREATLGVNCVCLRAADPDVIESMEDVAPQELRLELERDGEAGVVVKRLAEMKSVSDLTAARLTLIMSVSFSTSSRLRICTCLNAASSDFQTHTSAERSSIWGLTQVQCAMTMCVGSSPRVQTCALCILDARKSRIGA